MARLLLSEVYHRRDKPRKNAFRYGVFYVSVLLKSLSSHTSGLFSIDRFNVVSLFRKDHGACDGTEWSVWIDRQFQEHGITRSEGDRVELITHPRLIGYVFSPISFWLLIDAEERLRAVLCEVNNTFGDTHNYLLAHSDGRAIEFQDEFRADKKLYVSPFNTMEGHYTFHFEYTEKGFRTSIVYFKGSERVITTYLRGRFVPLTNGALAKALFMYPMMTFFIMARIHWQALILYLKGVPGTLALKPASTRGKTTRGEGK